MTEDYIGVVAGIVSAYLSLNSTRSEDVPTIIADVHKAITGMNRVAPEPEEQKPVLLMPWRKTIQREYLVSPEDGEHYRTLKRHVKTRGMTMDEYRQKWGLPNDYPSVCAAYSETRSELATSLGLGQSRARAKAAAAAQVSEPAPAPVIEAQAPVKKSKPKAEKKVTPHPKPKDKAAKAQKAPQEELEAA